MILGLTRTSPRSDPRRRCGAASPGRGRPEGLARITVVLLPLLSSIPGCPQTSDPPRREATEARAPSVASARRSDIAFYDVGLRPREIAVADLNGDAHLDVAVVNAGEGTLTVLLGDGSGRLGRSASFPAGGEPSDVDAVDLDRDGDVDFVVANHETPNVSVLLNDGAGRFVPSPGSPLDTGARPHLHGLATGDFDGAGWPDVAVESSETREVRVLRGGPRGLSAAVAVPVGTMPYYRLGVGEVTGEARPSILVPGHSDSTVRIIESGDGRLREAAGTIRLSGRPWMVVAGDVNGDGHVDIVAVETDAISVSPAGTRGFGQAPGSPFSVRGATGAAAGDLDGDGAADVAVGSWDGHEVTLLSGSPVVTRRVPMCERPIGLAIADLDGDGRGELLATCTHTNKLAVTTVFPR